MVVRPPYAGCEAPLRCPVGRDEAAGAGGDSNIQLCVTCGFCTFEATCKTVSLVHHGVYQKHVPQKVRPSAALSVTNVVGRIPCKCSLKPDAVEEVCDLHISWDRTFTGDSPAHVR